MKLLHYITMILLTGLAFTQTPIQTVDFESASGYTASPSESNNNTSNPDYWIRTNGITPAIYSSNGFTTSNGSYFFAAEDLDNVGAGAYTVTCDAASVSGYTNLQIKLLVGGTSTGGIEGEEYIKIQYNMDNAGWVTRAQFIGPQNTTNNTHYGEDANADGTIDGPAINETLSSFTYSIPVTGSSLQIRIEVYNGGTEEVAFDNIQILGEASLPVGLSSFSGKVQGSAVVLNWVTESELNNIGFILERQIEGDVTWATIASYKTCDALKGQGSTSNQTEYKYEDATVEPGKSYNYRLSDVSFDGKVSVHATLAINMLNLPEESYMENAHPNPFNPDTYITYYLKENTHVNISVYNCLGKLVKTIYDDQQMAGSYNVFWHGKNDDNLAVPSGTYIIRMKTPTKQQTQKIVLLK